MDADGERSLQGTSVPKWMRRPAERYGFEDMCASPPTNPDGFFHMRKLRQEKANAEQSVCSEPGDCLQKRKDAAGSSIQIEQHHHHQGAVNISKALANMEKASWMKGSQGILGGFQLNRYVSDHDCSVNVNSEGPQSALTSSSSAGGGGLHKTLSASSLLIHSESPAQSSDTSLPSSPTLKHRVIGGKGGGVGTERKEEMRMAMSELTKGTGLATADEGEQIVPALVNIPSVIVTKPVDAGHGDDSRSGLLSLIEKRLLIRRQSKSAPCTPETSPNATPAVSPSSSPQMGRRAGNPFFTGSSTSSSGSGSWLFRPAQPEVRPSSGSSDRSNNIFYESKVEVQVNPATKTVNKNVRYVPRPSELRELNFWSPTSM